MMAGSNALPTPGIIKITQKRAAPAPAASTSSSSRRQAGGRASKRYRRDVPDNDARVSAAAQLAEHASSGSSYLSTRTLPLTAPPSLVNVCLRRASDLIVELAFDTVRQYQNAQNQQGIATQRLTVLDDMPPTVMARLAPRVMQEASRLVSEAGFVAALLLNTFVQPDTTTEFILPGALSASYSMSTDLLRKLTKCQNITTLDLGSQGSLKDNVVKSVVVSLPHLTRLSLKGCTQAGDITVEAIAQDHLAKTLTHLNLNYTATTSRSLGKLISSARRLQSLKLASLSGLTDNAVIRMMDFVVSTMDNPSDLPLAALNTLKLKRTAISEVGLARILTHTSQLKRLDVSWTAVRSLEILRSGCTTPPQALEKLVLSGLNLRANSLIHLIKDIGDAEEPKLEILKIGSFGAALNAVSFSAEPLTPDTLKKLDGPLSRCARLNKLSLFGNERLGNNTLILSDFLSHIGRKCTTLDLTNVVRAGSDSHLPADTLAGLVLDESDDIRPPKIKTLILDGTRIDDGAAWILASCKDLESLHLANARISEEGLKEILRGCPRLTTLDLSGCRGLNMRWRRDAFALLDEDEAE